MPLPTFSFSAVSTTKAAGTAQMIVGEKFDNEATVTAGELKLPAWMQVVNPTTGMTSQQSATTLQSGYGANAARAYSQDGITFGLLVEPARANLINDQDLTNWVPQGGATVNSVAGPDGVTEDLEVEDANGASASRISQSFTPGNVVANHTLSVWHLLTAPAPTTGGEILYEDGLNDPSILVASVDADWTYADVTVAAIDNGSGRITPRVTTLADLGTMSVWGMQLELGAYPSSAQGVDNTTFARVADILRAGHKAIIDNDGFYTISMTYRPHYSESETTLDHNLIFLDADNRLFFRQSDGAMVFRTGGTDFVVGPITFSRHQELTITIEHSLRRDRLTVSGATTGDGDVRTTEPTAGVRHPTWVYILGSDTGAEEGSDLTGFDQDAQSFCDLILCRMLIQMDRDPGFRDFFDFLCALSEEAARLFDVCLVMQSAFDLDSAVGDQLDKIGSIVGLAREGALDARYRVFLKIQTELLLAGVRDDAEWTGTVANVLRITREFIAVATGTVLYTLHAPYNFQLSLPVTIPATEVALLMRFLSTAVYAGVLGFIQFPLSVDVWGSDALAVTDVGTWGSASVVVAGASIWDFVITTS